jgi:hypothetical protein
MESITRVDKVKSDSLTYKYDPDGRQKIDCNFSLKLLERLKTHFIEKDFPQYKAELHERNACNVLDITRPATNRNIATIRSKYIGKYFPATLHPKMEIEQGIGYYGADYYSFDNLFIYSNINFILHQKFQSGDPQVGIPFNFNTLYCILFAGLED